jgi:Cys-rich repeat protein
MISRAAARLSLAAVLSCSLPLFACNGQLRLEDDAGASILGPGDGDGGNVLPEASADAAPPPAGCTKDVECGLSTLHCDVVSGTCVACVSDDQCSGASKHRCDAALHRCVECGVDGDCGMGNVCVPGTRRCATTCHQLSECVILGDFCDTTRNICARCTDDSICKAADPDTPVCSPIGDCVECVTDATCTAAKPRCDRTTGSCVQCLGASDCKAGAPLCNPTTSACVSK